MVARTERDLERAAEAIHAQRPADRDLRYRSPLGAGLPSRGWRAEHAFGRLDILINNAGATQSGDFFKLDDGVWEDGFALKFYSYVRLSRALWPLLTARRARGQHHRRRVQVPPRQLHDRWCGQRRDHQFHEGAGRTGAARRGRGQRGASGHDRDRPARYSADQRAEAEGICREAYERQELARGGLRRYGQPEDIANLVAFLASPAAEQIHGADVFIDGGATKTIL